MIQLVKKIEEISRCPAIKSTTAWCHVFCDSRWTSYLIIIGLIRWFLDQRSLFHSLFHESLALQRVLNTRSHFTYWELPSSVPMKSADINIQPFEWTMEKNISVWVLGLQCVWAVSKKSHLLSDLSYSFMYKTVKIIH